MATGKPETNWQVVGIVRNGHNIDGVCHGQVRDRVGMVQERIQHPREGVRRDNKLEGNKGYEVSIGKATNESVPGGKEHGAGDLETKGCKQGWEGSGTERRNGEVTENTGNVVAKGEDQRNTQGVKESLEIFANAQHVVAEMEAVGAAIEEGERENGEVLKMVKDELQALRKELTVTHQSIGKSFASLGDALRNFLDMWVEDGVICEGSGGTEAMGSAADVPVNPGGTLAMEMEEDSDRDAEGEEVEEGDEYEYYEIVSERK